MTLTLVTTLAVVFPSGRLPVGRWRRPTLLLLGGMAAATLVAAVWPVSQASLGGGTELVHMPNPLGLVPPDRNGPGADQLASVSVPAMYAALAMATTSLLVRYRRSRGPEHLQVRWLVAGLASVLMAVPLGYLSFAVFGLAGGGLVWLPATVSFALPPIAIGVAVTRYRLYELDRLISRSLGWVVLSTMLLGVYAGGIIVLQGLLGGVLQGETLAVAASTLLAAALFQPCAARPAGDGPQVRPCPVRRRAHGNRLRRASPRRGRPGSGQQRARGRGRADDAAHERGRLASWRADVIRLVAAACAWMTTAALGIAMLWTLTVGGYLGELAEGNAAVDETMLATTYLALGFIIAITIAYATVGLLLATRTGGGRVGAVLLAGGLSFAAIPFGYLVGGFLIQVDPADPLANAVFLLGPASIPIGYSMILPVIALVFPHGRLPSRRWRWPAGLVAALLLGSTGIRILAPGEIAGSTSRKSVRHRGNADGGCRPGGHAGRPRDPRRLGPRGRSRPRPIPAGVDRRAPAASLVRCRRDARGHPDCRVAPAGDRRPGVGPPRIHRPGARSRVRLDRDHPLPPVRDRPDSSAGPSAGRS